MYAVTSLPGVNAGVSHAVGTLILRAKISWNSRHEERYGDAGERLCRRPPPDLSGGRRRRRDKASHGCNHLQGTQTEAATLYGFFSSWASKWFNRLERLAGEAFESVVYDKPRDGRPSELSDEEHEHFVKVLHDPPEDAGLDAPAWSVPLARHYLSEEFGVEYCERHVRRLMSEAGLSSRTARPGYYKSDERAQGAWQNGFKKA